MLIILSKCKFYYILEGVVFDALLRFIGYHVINYWTFCSNLDGYHVSNFTLVDPVNT